MRLLLRLCQLIDHLLLSLQVSRHVRRPIIQSLIFKRRLKTLVKKVNRQVMIYPKEHPQLTRIRLMQLTGQMRWEQLHRSLEEEVQLPQRTRKEEKCRSMNLENLQDLATKIHRINSQHLMRSERLERVPTQLLMKVTKKLLTQPKVSRVNLNSISLQQLYKIISIFSNSILRFTK